MSASDDHRGASTEWLQFDWDRGARTGVGEAVLASGKSAAQLEVIVGQADERGHPLLLTRLEAAAAEALAPMARQPFDYDAVSRTAFLGQHPERPGSAGAAAVVAAGSSDLPVASEARRTLEFWGVRDVPLVGDVGVAGLWRLLERVDELRERRVLIAVAGMEGALFSVLAGLVGGLVIAVPSSVGYGVSAAGEVALKSALASCAPGVVTVNIDNGYGAACAALKLMRAS
ncbi:MAG: nickel pincer cofactor biosynthesis protein LarB [Pseudomonadota bacterium]